MKRIRAGFVGFGFIGPHHAEAMRRLGFVDVAGVCTADMEETRAKAAQYAIPRTFESFEQMAADPDIDRVGSLNCKLDIYVILMPLDLKPTRR